MLHELLLALSGDSGGIYVYDKFAGIQVAADLPFVHESEISLLNRICGLGTYFQKFQTFCKKYSGVSPYVGETQRDGENFQEPFGLYIQAFCTGLDQVLDSYRNVLVDLEKQILKDPKLPLTYIEHSLEQYQGLFPALWSVIEHIQASKAFGCQILDVLQQSCICGIPDVKDALERILFVCHGVMYQQLSAWVLHGILIDKHNEFFIKEITSADKQTANWTDDSAAGMSNGDLGIPGITGRQLAEILEGEGKKEIAAQWQFRINAEMLPSYIPTRVADKILFIGESVGMFQGSRQTKTSHQRSALVLEKEEEFTLSLYALQQQPKFNLMLFESEIDKIRLCVAEHLWKLVVENVNLLKHLKILKDFFLLGRGELFSAFIEHARDLLKLPPSNNTSHDVHAAFLQVLSKFLPDDDEAASMFTIMIDKELTQRDKKKKTASEADQTGPVVSGWDCIKLEYDVQWPLHILFQPVVLDKYNSLFRFLLKVKRTQMDLQQVWAAYMGTKHLSTAQISNMTKIWLSRMHMAFLVNNLQYYLQVDVLEAQYSQLLEKINSTRDFEAIRLGHDHFITTLTAQSFLLMKPVKIYR